MNTVWPYSTTLQRISTCFHFQHFIHLINLIHTFKTFYQTEINPYVLNYMISSYQMLKTHPNLSKRMALFSIKLGKNTLVDRLPSGNIIVLSNKDKGGRV